MTEQSFNWESTQDALRHVREDMYVYDRSGERIGKVTEIVFGETDERGLGAATPSSRSLRGDTIVDRMADAVGGGETMPESVRQRMLQEGYIRVNLEGIFSGSRYVLAGQIDRVQDDQVLLRITRDQMAHT